MKKISIVIPVKNEEAILEENYEKLRNYMKKIKVGYEMIFVENGSTDKTLEILKEIGRKDKGVMYISLPKPCYGEAMKIGSLKAKHDVFIYSMDLTMGLTFVERAIKLLEKYPVVNGSRYMKGSHIDRNMLRHFTSSFYHPFINFVYGSKYTDFDGIKAFRKEVVKKIMKKSKCSRNFFFTEILLMVHNSKIPFIEIPVDHVEKRKSRFGGFYRLVFWQVVDWLANNGRVKKLKI